MKPVQDTGGQYIPDEMFVREARWAYEEAIKAQGQLELPQ
jgi:hypothetical protein